MIEHPRFLASASVSSASNGSSRSVESGSESGIATYIGDGCGRAGDGCGRAGDAAGMTSLKRRGEGMPARWELGNPTGDPGNKFAAF